MGRLQLKGGEMFSGESVGSPENVSGEVVFNTGMVGYTESMTDPSYKGQILVFTYPLIGNYGVPGPERESGLLKTFESDKIQPSAVIMGEMSHSHSHWASRSSLEQWLIREGVPALAGVDTRRLAKWIRKEGTVQGVLTGGGSGPVTGITDSPERPLASRVSIREPREYPAGKIRVVLVDCGVKNSIIHHLRNRNVTVIQVPWNCDFKKISADGYLLSNGPGDPRFCVETIENTRGMLSGKKPVLGICLGSQILALAAGADTLKMHYGHRGHNQPCLETGTRRCYITSQNHGYAVDARTLPEDWREWFVNLNDGSNEGIMHVSKPLFGAQFHPEAAPGPEDTEFLFDMFVRAMQ